MRDRGGKLKTSTLSLVRHIWGWAKVCFVLWGGGCLAYWGYILCLSLRGKTTHTKNLSSYVKELSWRIELEKVARFSVGE